MRREFERLKIGPPRIEGGGGEARYFLDLEVRSVFFVVMWLRFFPDYLAGQAAGEQTWWVKDEGDFTPQVTVRLGGAAPRHSGGVKGTTALCDRAVPRCRLDERARDDRRAAQVHKAGCRTPQRPQDSRLGLGGCGDRVSERTGGGSTRPARVSCVCGCGLLVCLPAPHCLSDEGGGVGLVAYALCLWGDSELYMLAEVCA